jgi:F-type H+-transporting ATPase subunit epsilon
MLPCFRLQVITPAGLAYSGEVVHARVPAENGSVGILANHAPYVTSSSGGELRIREKGAVEEKIYTVAEGFFEVARNEASLLTQSLQPNSP